MYPSSSCPLFLASLSQTYWPAIQTLDATSLIWSRWVSSPNCSSFRCSLSRYPGPPPTHYQTPFWPTPHSLPSPILLSAFAGCSETCHCLLLVSSKGCQLREGRDNTCLHVHSQDPGHWLCSKCLHSENKLIPDGAPQESTGGLSVEALPPPPGKCQGPGLPLPLTPTIQKGCSGSAFLVGCVKSWPAVKGTRLPSTRTEGEREAPDH